MSVNVVLSVSLFTLYVIVLRLVSLQCVAEPYPAHDAACVTSIENSPFRPTAGRRHSLAAGKSVSLLAARAECSTQRMTPAVEPSPAQSEQPITGPNKPTRRETRIMLQNGDASAGEVAAPGSAPAQLMHATPEQDSTVGDEMRTESRDAPRTTYAAYVTGNPSAGSAVPAATSRESLPETPLEAPHAVSTGNADDRPPAPVKAVESTSGATVLLVRTNKGIPAAADDAASAAFSGGFTAETTALSATPFISPAASLRLAEEIASAPSTTETQALAAERAERRKSTPTLAASSVPFRGAKGVTEESSFRRHLKGQENAVCRHVAVEAQAVCKKVRPVQRTYPCRKQVVEKHCEEVPIVIQKMCTKTYHERKPFKCDRVEYKSECIQKKETTRTECVQTVIKEEGYPCPKVDYVTKCNSKPALTPSVCKHEVQKEFQYPCERTVKEEQCEEVEKEVDQVCEEDIVVPEKYDCSKTVYVKKCTPASAKGATGIRAAGGEVPALATEGKDEVPTEGDGEKAPRRLRKVVAAPEAIVVPLPKTQLSVEMCVDVPQVKRKTCTRDVVKKERRPCKGVKKEMQCKNVTKVIHEVCSKVKTVVEPYACTKTEMQQECSTVAKQVEDTCTRQVPVDEKGPCEVEIFKNECVPVPVRIPDVCFETRPKTEVYDCSENSSKSICKEEVKETEQQCVQTEYREVEYACTQLEQVEKCVIPDRAPPVVLTPLQPQKYAKKQQEKTRSMPPSEVGYEEEEEEEEEQVEEESFRNGEQNIPHASLYTLEPLMKKEYATVMIGPQVKRPKMKWREKLHKLGDPDLGEEKKEGEEVQEAKKQPEDGGRSKQ